MTKAQLMDFYTFGTFKIIAIFIIFYVVTYIYRLTALQPIRPYEKSYVTDQSFLNANFQSVQHSLPDLLNTYLHIGHSLALDKSFMLKHYEHLFEGLSYLPKGAPAKMLVNKETILELDQLKLDAQYGFISKRLLQLIDEVSMKRPDVFEILEYDEMQMNAMRMNPTSQSDRSIAPYVVADRYRLTNVVFLSEDQERNSRAKSLGLPLYPLHTKYI